MRYTILTKVIAVFKYEPIVRTGFKKSADENHEVITRDAGWFIRLEGSFEAIHVGMEKPMMDVGDEVKIILEKVVNRQSAKESVHEG